MARTRRWSPSPGSWYRPTGPGRSTPVTRTPISPCPRFGEARCKCLGWPSSNAAEVAPSRTRSIWLRREGLLERSSLTSLGPAMRSSPCLTLVSAATNLHLFRPLPLTSFPSFPHCSPPPNLLLGKKAAALFAPT